VSLDSIFYDFEEIFEKKNNFGHHGARNGAQTDLTLCAITRPFLKKEP